MNTPQIDPGKGWRLLEEGEPLADGDEFYSPESKRWIPREERQLGIAWPWRRRVEVGKVDEAEMVKDGWLPICEAPSEGVFLVWLETPMLGSQVQVMNKRINYATIGSQFASDAPKPLYWQPLPKPPQEG